MSRRLTPGSPTSRFAALLLLAAVVTLVWLLLIAPAIDARHALDQELDATRALRQRFQSQSVLRPRGDATAIVPHAPTVPVAAAMLQTRLEAIIEDAGGTIDRMEALSLPRRRATARLDPVGATAAFAATTAQLRAVLIGIETDSAAIIVDELSVRADQSPAPDAAGESERLRIEIAVRGFRPHGAGR